MEKQFWVIAVNGYGEWLFEGTETEAEEARAHKANWERGIGRKRLASEEEVKTGQPIEQEGFSMNY